MQVSLDLVNLFLYAAQQLGVMLGVGSQTILLITYAISVRDGIVDAKESQIARAVTKALVAGLGLMVISGVAITALHFIAGQWMILFAPAYVFKWVLIGFLIVATFLWRKRPFPDFVWEGIIGASWYALFMVHIIAPVASWFDLLVLYVVWVAGFLLLWSAGVFMTHKKVEGHTTPQPAAPSRTPSPEQPHKERTPQSAPLPPPKPVPVAPKVVEKKPEQNIEPKPEQKIEPKPIVPPPVPVVAKTSPPPSLKVEPKPVIASAPPLPLIKPEPEKKPLPQITSVLPPQPPVAPSPKPVAPAVPEPPKPSADEHGGLPAIRVMPRTKEDLAKHI